MGIWDEDDYVIKQKVLTVGRKYYIESARGERVGFCKQKMFKLKEDIRIYSDESMNQEILLVKQEQILDFSGTFKVKDSLTGEEIGYVGRKGLKSLVRDTWRIFDLHKNEIGIVQERGGVLSVLRRFSDIARMIPKKYDFLENGRQFARARQKFKIIGDTWFVEIEPNSSVDKRLILTAALMMDIVEQASSA